MARFAVVRMIRCHLFRGKLPQRSPCFRNCAFDGKHCFSRRHTRPLYPEALTPPSTVLLFLLLSIKITILDPRKDPKPAILGVILWGSIFSSFSGSGIVCGRKGDPDNLPTTHMCGSFPVQGDPANTIGTRKRSP